MRSVYGMLLVIDGIAACAKIKSLISGYVVHVAKPVAAMDRVFFSVSLVEVGASA